MSNRSIVAPQAELARARAQRPEGGRARFARAEGSGLTARGGRPRLRSAGGRGSLALAAGGKRSSSARQRRADKGPPGLRCGASRSAGHRSSLRVTARRSGRRARMIPAHPAQPRWPPPLRSVSGESSRHCSNGPAPEPRRPLPSSARQRRAPTRPQAECLRPRSGRPPHERSECATGPSISRRSLARRRFR